MSAHVLAFYLDKHRRSGGLFDVWCNNTWETAPRLRNASIDAAADLKIALHKQGHLSVTIRRAGTFDPVAIW